MTASREEKYAKLDEWNNLKKYLAEKDYIETPKIIEGEIWWVAVGENVGVEIGGKGSTYTRPVLIYKKLSPQGFLGLPLTTKSHGGTWYIRNYSDSKRSYFVLSQARIFSIKSVFGRIGLISDNEFKRIKRKFIDLYS